MYNTYSVINKYDTLLLVGVGGLGSAVFRRMFNYLMLLGYENLQGKSQHTVDVFVFEPDEVDDIQSVLKIGFPSYPRLFKRKRPKKADVIRKNIPNNVFVKQAVNDIVITPSPFTEVVSNFLAKNRQNFGRMLVIDATDKKSVTVPLYYDFLLPDDTLIIAGYDAPTKKQDNSVTSVTEDLIDFAYTIYINPPEELANTFKSVYESIPLSPLHAELVASLLWLIVSHYPLEGLQDAELTGSFTDILIQLDEVGMRIKDNKIVDKDLSKLIQTS